MPPKAKTSLHTALKVISAEQLVAFFRAAGMEQRPVAIKIANSELDKGLTLEAFAAKFMREPERQMGLALVLDVVRLSPRVFRITYGLAGGEVGDGGEWRVTYKACGRVARCKQQGWWVS